MKEVVQNARRRAWCYAIPVIAALLLGTPGIGRAQPRAAPETELEAAFILNFARYTEWPATAFTNAKAPVVFGVLGESPVAESLKKILQDQKIGSRSAEFLQFTSVKEITNCHVVFLPESQRARLKSVLSTLDRRPVLTVGDFPPFASNGGMIGFVRRNGRLQFEVNPEAAERAGLRLSSRLLHLAIVVRTEP